MAEPVFLARRFLSLW